MISRFPAVAKALFAAGALAAAVLMGAAPASAGYIKTGVLTCTVAPGFGMVFGSSKSMRCTFRPDFSRSEHYGGHIDKVGVDIGVSISR